MSEPSPVAEQRNTHRVPMSKMRKAIARQTTLSIQIIPHFYSQIEIDMLPAQTMLVNLRTRDLTVKLSLLHILVKACALTLREHPRLNAYLEDNTIVYNDEVNIGLVVALEEGMLIPVIHRADKLSLSELAAQTGEVIDRARRQRPNADDLLNATFTVSSLGKEGPDSFTSIIRFPQCAIFALGTVAERPYVRGGQLVVAPTLIATLGVDHRIIDGAHASAFLLTFKRILETPELATLLA